MILFSSHLETTNHNKRFLNVKQSSTLTKVFCYQKVIQNDYNKNLVTFPARPLLSPDAKDFIRACLIYRKEDRADIFTLASHSYLKENGFI